MESSGDERFEEEIGWRQRIGSVYRGRGRNGRILYISVSRRCRRLFLFLNGPEDESLYRYSSCLQNSSSHYEISPIPLPSGSLSPFTSPHCIFARSFTPIASNVSQKQVVSASSTSPPPPNSPPLSPPNEKPSLNIPLPFYHRIIRRVKE